jgi:CRP/FNR family transcriptional regulator
MPECPGCNTRERSLFCSLAGKHLDRLDREKVVHTYRAGHTIFYEGTVAAGVYCISTGLVRLYKMAPGEREVMIRLLQPGDIMGYRAVIAGEVLAATAEAVHDTTVCMIPRTALVDLMRDDCDLAFSMMAKLARELRVSEDDLVTRLHETVTQRTVRALLWMAEGLGHDGSPALDLNLPVRREDLAHMIGTTPETLSRTLHGLAGRGILRVDRRRLRILRVDALEAILKPTA